MQWLPLPTDFRGDLRAALAQVDAVARLEQLSSLSNRRLDFVQTIQLDQAVRRQATEGAATFQPLKLALLASHTVEHLVSGITVAGLRRRLLIQTYVAPYGQYRQTVLANDSPLLSYRPDFLLFSLSPQQLLASVPSTASSQDAAAAVSETVDMLKLLWTEARERYGATIVQQTFMNVAEPLFGSYDRIAAGAPVNVIARLNDRVVEAAAEQAVSVLDIARQTERDGLDSWFDRARWLQGKLEVSPVMVPAYGEILVRVIGAHRGLAKKCLVLDLDNTLWGGVVGDVGQEGLVLGEGSGTGEAYLALQRYAKQLRDRGVVLAVCSKNDPTIAHTVFRDHPEMLLKPSDIAVFVANWEDKASNLVQIAERLNIGIDSLVFVDDNPAERARVRESLPMVAVPELPDDPSQYVRCLADAGYFEAIAYTAEDAQRAQQYAMNASRETLRLSADSLDGFLKGLEMNVAYGVVGRVDLQRVAQLVNKTNQFNPTTKRYSLQEITELTADEKCVALQFRLLDRLGDNGLVSVMILKPSNTPAVLEVDTWVMSCRVFGRQLEMEAMNIAAEIARARGATSLRGTYMPTAKNGVVKDLYAKLGFVQVDQLSSTQQATHWLLPLDSYAPHQTFITRRLSVATAETEPA